MDRIRAVLPGYVALLLGLLLVLLPSRITAAEVAYCSSQNTGSDSEALFWTWQSNGWCFDQCNKQGTAYGVILEKNCWCSNYAPEDQEDTGDCNDDCPGFPSEKCGNKADNLYIYIKVNGQPSGTKGGSAPTSANVSPSSPPTSSSPELSSEAPPPSETMTSDKPSSTLKTSASSAPTSETSPVTSVQIVTVSGVIVTQTVISSPSSAPQLNETKKSGTNVGAIVGGVLGGVALLAAVVGAVLFLLWRRRRQRREDDDPSSSGVQRNTSTMSKAGLLRGEKTSPYPPQIATSFNKRNSRTLDQESISPISGSDRRSSRPYIFDQRLNPSAIMTLDNTSRGSFASMDDSRDYGRTLNVRNPDPDPQ